MSYKNLLILVLLLSVAWLSSTVLNLAMENDGLKQVADSHRQSIDSLLKYVSVATKCNVTAQEVAAVVKATTSAEGLSKEVAHLAFKASFDDRGIAEVSIVDVKKVEVCRAQ